MSCKRLRPASTLKVITAVTALKELGADYNFTTRVAYTGSEPDSVRTWHGDIYIIGGMNPRMRQSDIAGMAKAIRQLGVDSITNDLCRPELQGRQEVGCRMVLGRR